MGKKYLYLFIIFFLISYSSLAYKALAGLWDSDLIEVLNLDDEGNLTIEKTITLSTTAEEIAISPNGIFAFSHSINIHSYSIDNNQNVTYIGDSYEGGVSFVSITTDLNYLMFFAWPNGNSGLQLYKINDDLSLSSTGSYIPYTSLLHPLYYKESKFNNTIIANNYEYKEIAIFRRNNDELIDTGQRIDITPYNGAGDLVITPNGRFAYISAGLPNATVCCEIFPNGDVTYKGVVNNVATACIRVTSDSKYLIMIDSYNSLYKIRSYRIETDGSLTLVCTIDNMELAQAMDITPDNKFVLVAWHYTSSTQTLSVFQLYSDGTLEKLDKDQIWSGGFSDIRFIPPYVTSTDDEIWEMYK